MQRSRHQLLLIFITNLIIINTYKVERNKSWIYGIKLGADFSFEESRSMVITEQKADEMKKVFDAFSKIIE